MTDRWEEYAVCRGQYTEDFYPESSCVLDITKRVCEGCPVREACFIAAIPERWGFWAGMTMTDRDRMRSRMRLVLAPDDRDVPKFRRAAQRGFETGDYASALEEVLEAKGVRSGSKRIA